ncbi:MAG: hypothetical protein IJ374_03190, partial [Lachnospiraceae bacterium]|nr:hypothetical protein [Lachnospiraceae bacterium]
VVVFRDSHINISQTAVLVNNFFQVFLTCFFELVQSRSLSRPFLTLFSSCPVPSASGFRFLPPWLPFLFSFALSLKDKAYLTTRSDKSQHLFSKIFELF